MHVLVLGGGGREHALVRAIKSSKKVSQVGCAPGNPGIALEARTYLADPLDPKSVLALAKQVKPDLIIIGPEAPLAHGVSDYLRQNHYLVFAPTQQAAQLETSKVFSKDFLNRHQIPTARSRVCKSGNELEEACKEFGLPCVVKVDGLAAGKGVRILLKEDDARLAVKDIFEEKKFGSAGQSVLVEEFIDGQEISVMLLVSKTDYALLPVSRDHKKLCDGNQGPNTGGMGAFAPVKLKPNLMKTIEKAIIQPTVEGLAKDGIDYQGVLYVGLMIKDDQPYVLEYNVRFGDPEAQVLLPLLQGDWFDVFHKIAKGEKIPKLKWKPQHVVSVVLAGPGYPEISKKGIKIKIDKNIKQSPTNYLLHAGTAAHKGYVTSGGRVLNVVGIDKTLAGARKKAYTLLKNVEFPGMQFRTDIAQKN